MQVLKPISPEDKKILLTDSYYTALQRNSYLLEGIAEGRFNVVPLIRPLNSVL